MSGGFIGLFGIDDNPPATGETWDTFLGYPPPYILGQVQFLADQPDDQGGWANYEGSAAYIRDAAGDRTRPMVVAVGFFPQAGSGEVANTIELAAQGFYNQHYTNVAQSIAQYWPSAIVRVAWEFNGTWYPWSRCYAADQTNYAAHYIAAFRNVVQCFLAVSPQFTFAFNPALSPFWDSQPPWDCFPGADVCQYAGIDAYDTMDTSHPDPQDRWNAWQGPALGILAQQCASWGVPACIPEWGQGAYGDNPLYVDLMSQWCLGQPTPVLQCYWNSDASYQGSLNDYPNAKQQYFLQWRNPWIQWPASAVAPVAAAPMLAAAVAPKPAPALPPGASKPSKLVVPPANRLIKWKAAA